MARLSSWVGAACLLALSGCGGGGGSGAPCDTGDDCALGEVCIDGMCADDTPTGCTSSAECDPGESCVDDRCVPDATGCEGDDDCDPDERCVDSSCVPDDSCTGDGDCGAGERCLGGACVPDEGTTDAGPPGGDAGPGMDAGPGEGMDAGMMMPSFGDDADGDGISDFQEGRFDAGGPADTDGDGTPDYLDTDSDGDGIPDSVEAGDMSITSPPIDSDFDGIPDFRDLDSDDNGVPDRIEGAGDVDGDGRPAFRDLDNDDDGLFDTDEIGPDPAAPLDTDGDGAPDYDDVDSDGDTIADSFELTVDTDGDGIPDLRDLDSDRDGFSDAEEAGDADLATDPVDTDGDTIPDFRDPDSDGDGLSDEAERAAGTGRTDPDSDDDGVSDLIEVGAGTDPLDGTDSPRSRGDFVFVVPYMAPPMPTSDTLQFATNLQRADVYFMMDNTGSMSGTISGLQAGLTGTVIPDIRARIPDAWFGVGGFDDYPFGGYGGGAGTDTRGITHDTPFFQYETMTPDAAVAQAGVNAYKRNWGADGPESAVAALFSLSTRDNLSGYARFSGSGATPPGCPAGHTGTACFRPTAVPIVVVMTDVEQHNSPTCGAPWSTCTYTFGGAPTWAQMLAGLAAINARVVGIDTSGGASAFLNRLVQDTTIARGAPGPSSDYVLRSAPGGAGLTGAVTDAVRRAAQVPLDVSARATDIDHGDGVDAVAAFLDHLETRGVAAPGLTCTLGLTTLDGPGIDADAFHDTFDNVTPGAPVCFDIFPKMNDTVMPTLVPQLFRAQIDVLGDGFTPLDDRVIFFLVPPRIPDPNE